MLLSSTMLKESVESGRIFKNWPAFDTKYIKPSSIDLTIGCIYEPANRNIEIDEINSRKRETYILKPGDTILIEVAQVFSLANDLGGIVFPPNKLAKQGIIMTNPGHIDPGYKGLITVCLVNMGKGDECLKVGEVIARLLVLKVDSLTEGYKDRQEVISISPAHLNKLGKDFAGLEGRISSILLKYLMKRAMVMLAIITTCLGILALVIPELSEYRIEQKNHEIIVRDLIEPLKSDISLKVTESKINNQNEIYKLKGELRKLEHENQLFRSELESLQSVSGKSND